MSTDIQRPGQWFRDAAKRNKDHANAKLEELMKLEKQWDRIRRKTHAVVEGLLADAADCERAARESEQAS